MQKCAQAEPEERARVHPGAVGKNAREKCDALTVTLGVVILALDGIAPVVRHLQEPSLQGRVAPLDLCDAVLCLETRVESVRLIEIRQHVAVPLLRPIEFCQLLRHVRFEQ